MYFYKIGLVLLAFAHGALSEVNERCSSGNGVCISTSNCKKMGGTYESGLCPNDPEDIKCCNKSSCTVDGKTGVCKFTSDCKGTSLPGVCPGPSNFQCCVSDDAVGTSCSYQGLSGTCKNVSDCNGFRVKGLCPGPADVQCCLPKNTCLDGGKTGQCIPTSQCDGYSVTGKCPGAKDIQCCLGGTSCSYQGLTGTCKNVSNCNGFRVRGLCPGPADVQCCLPKHSCSDGGKSGQCIPTGQCDGYTVTGKCPGGTDIKCCLGSGTTCSYQGLTGTCKNVSNCTGFRVQGLCPGPADVQCCLPKHSCSDGGKSGQCIPTGQCDGNTVTGKCPGGKDIKCCLGGRGGGGLVSGDDCIEHYTISSAAVAIAWETKGMGEGNDGTKTYRNVKDAIFPNDQYYQSCDRGVATAVRWSGADDNFPVGDTRVQDNYLSNSSLWTFVGKYDQNYGKLSPGDIVITTPSRRISNKNHGHIVLYVGNESIRNRYPNSKGEFVSASYGSRSPGCGDKKSDYLNDNYHIYHYNGSYKGKDFYAYAVCTDDYIDCYHDGESGQCMYTSECKKTQGTIYSNLCPGPSDFKCCIPKRVKPEVITSDEKCKAKKGECMPYTFCHSGNTQKGICPGGDSYVCCINGDNKCKFNHGTCTAPENCGEIILDNYCSGSGSTTKCCVPVADVPSYTFGFLSAADLDVEPATLESISDLTEAIAHYRGGSGKDVPLNREGISELMDHDSFKDFIKELKQNLSSKVSKAKVGDNIKSDHGSYRGLNSYVLGSYSLHIYYNFNVKSGTNYIIVHFWGTNPWDFKKTGNGIWYDLWHEDLPNFAVGDGKDFTIDYDFYYRITVKK